MGILIITIATASYLLFKPHSYPRNYISQDEDYKFQQSLRIAADKAKFYLGAASNSYTMAFKEFTGNFNSITPESSLKLGAVLRNKSFTEYNFTEADKFIDFATSNNFRVRGHTLIWGKLSDEYEDPNLENYLENFSIAERSHILGDYVQNHIKIIMTRYKGRIAQWDVVNEPLDRIGGGKLKENVFYRYLGPEYIDNAFHTAHLIDPEAELFLNEQLMNYHDSRAEGFYTLVTELLDKGVPIHGVGIQGHIFFSRPSIKAMSIYLKRFTNLGLKVELTEVDARLRLFNREDDPYEAQGEYYGNLLEMCLENPGITGLTFWGITDASCWYDELNAFVKPNEPYLFDAQMHPNPVMKFLYKAFQDNKLTIK